MTSLLRPHTNVLMRQCGDKEIQVLDLDDLFDQYVETDQLQHFSDNTVEPSNSDDLAHLFDLPVSNDSDPLETSPLPNWDVTVDAWHKALQTFQQNPASPTIPPNALSVYPESRGKASLSDPQLFDIDDLFDLDEAVPRLSLSTPSTPPPRLSKPARKAVATPDRSVRHGISKSNKKPSRFFRMMRPSQYRANIQDMWSRKMESSSDAFNLTLPPHVLPASPPPSTKFKQEENSNGFFAQDHSYTISMPPFSDADTTASNYQLTPLSSPAIDINSRNGNTNTFNHFSDSNGDMATSYLSHQMNNAALSALQTPPTSHRLSMAAWGPDTPASLDFSFSASPDFSSPNTGKSQAWWGNGTAVTAPQPGASANYHSASQSRASSGNQNLSFSTASVAGLGISCDTTSFSSFGGESETGRQASHGSNGFGPSSASSFEIGYAPMYASQPAGIPISQSSPLPSRSPSLSPNLQPMRFTRRRQSSNHSHHSTTHNRRKSSNSSSGTGAGSRSAPVGFVNFTPHDSRKILTGVAPSGSSKTKARREKEAAEKRRKLSQAAVKAVIEAGGDIGRLEKEGLLMLGSEG
ncbi:hypothetical protein BDV96DRAFT_494797 [Lophiotrema nucula]|uniref:Developmental regulatory protein wetA n=1 Tax=Lophiotrema nucula TaxID=690887 RepID=A0A6A5Z4W8_9PLEO|nr:hypothetical protein BDV96DRAFT_494797 [Lophiotrema nucula]